MLKSKSFFLRPLVTLAQSLFPLTKTARDPLARTGTIRPGREKTSKGARDQDDPRHHGPKGDHSENEEPPDKESEKNDEPRYEHGDAELGAAQFAHSRSASFHLTREGRVLLGEVLLYFFENPLLAFGKRHFPLNYREGPELTGTSASASNVGDVLASEKQASLLFAAIERAYLEGTCETENAARRRFSPPERGEYCWSRH